MILMKSAEGCGQPAIRISAGVHPHPGPDLPEEVKNESA